MNIKLELPLDDVIGILNTLAELPYKRVGGLIANITKQVEEQERAVKAGNADSKEG